MFKKPWKNWLVVITLLLVTNVASWNRQKIAELFETEKPAGDINIGVLIDDKSLSGNEAEEIALAQSYLSESYHWVCIKRAKVPLPMPPFSEGTGFHFRPISKRQKPTPQLMARN